MLRQVFSMDIREFKKTFDRSLKRYLRRKIGAYRRLTSDSFILDTIGYAETLALAGGKRVRPYMAYITYKAAGGRSDAKAIELFIALELFHLFALVHDDIMDRGQERHGRPTTHIRVASEMKRLKRAGDIERLGEAQAILLGDLLFAWANELMANSVCSQTFFKMVNEVMVGQMIDVDLMSRPSVSGQLINDKMRLKTAGYTFVRPMQMGAALAGANGKTARFCEEYGLPLGIGFQIQDDFLDLNQSVRVAGKTVFSDLKDRQHTVFTQHIFESGNKKYIQELKGLFGKTLSETHRARVRNLFTESGAFSEGERLIRQSFSRAERAVHKAGFSKTKAQPFLDLISYIRARSA